MADIVAALSELAQAEGSLARTYGHALFLYTTGALREADRTAYHTARDAVYALERTLDGLVRPVLEAVGHGDAMPTPQPLPDLPPLSSMPRYLEAASINTAGLGAAVPAGLFAVLVLALLQRLALLAVIGWAVTRAIDVGTVTLQNILSARENTKRIEQRMQMQQKRFAMCLERTQDPGRCAGLFPLPEPPLEGPQSPPSDPIATGIGIGAAVTIVGVAGWFGWEFWSARTSSRGISRGRKLSEREVTRRLTA